MAGTPEGMIFVSGGRFRMGSVDFYPEERPVREVEIDDFWMDEHPVTVGAFRRFVKATGYVTRASSRSTPATTRMPIRRCSCPDRWSFTRRTVGSRSMTTQLGGGTSRARCGSDRGEPGSDVYTRGRVVHVAHEDAGAYAAWAGKALSTEAEWEYAARGGLDQAIFCWGDEFMPGGELRANTWHGEFPYQHDQPDCWLRTSPVKTYPLNGYGLFNMAGNVWEWTDDFYSTPSGESPERPC